MGRTYSRRTAHLIAATTVLATMTAACGSSDDSTGPEGGGGDDQIKVGLSTIGPRNDRSCSQEHYEGVVKAEVEIDGLTLGGYVENADTAQTRIDAFKNLASAGNDLILGRSAGIADAAPAVTPSTPDKHFVVSTGATAKV